MSRRGDKPSIRLANKTRVKIRTATRAGSSAASRPPLRELPLSLRDLKRGRALTDEQAVDALRWLQDVIDDAANAAGVE